MAQTWSFDSDLTRNYTQVRQAFISAFLEGIHSQVSFQSALDVGCGVGYFSKFLSERGLSVVAVDGRDENVKEGQRRHPGITFLTRNVEDPSLQQLGVFDFVLCVGLLYHLENPFQAVRNLHALTGKVLVVESMCAPGSQPSLLMLDEGKEDNQGLNYVALYPTESSLVKMLCRAGFPFVYRFSKLPPDPQFTTTLSRKRSRTFLAASKLELFHPNLVIAKEPINNSFGTANPWSTLASRTHDFYRSKVFAIRHRLARVFSAQ